MTIIPIKDKKTGETAFRTVGKDKPKGGGGGAWGVQWASCDSAFARVNTSGERELTLQEAYMQMMRSDKPKRAHDLITGQSGESVNWTSRQDVSNNWFDKSHSAVEWAMNAGSVPAATALAAQALSMEATGVGGVAGAAGVTTEIATPGAMVTQGFTIDAVTGGVVEWQVQGATTFSTVTKGAVVGTTAGDVILPAAAVMLPVAAMAAYSEYTDSDLYSGYVRGVVINGKVTYHQGAQAPKFFVPSKPCMQTPSNEGGYSSSDYKWLMNIGGGGGGDVKEIK